MLNKLSAFYRRFFLPCFRKRRLLLSVIILCALVIYLMHYHLRVDLSNVRFNGAILQADIEEAPRRKLIFLQMLFRHGHHSPFSVYPRDPNPVEYWVQGLGELTKLGKLQHYAVGKYMRHMYEDFLGDSVQEVDCMTSLSSRSHYGAFAFLAGLYPAPPDKRLEEHMPVQPIPCSYYPIIEDKYLQSIQNCQAAKLDKAAITRTSEAREFMGKYQKLYKFWSAVSGFNVKTYREAGFLYKTLLSEKTENMTIPNWAKYTLPALEANSDKCYYFHFKTRLLHRLRGGPLIGKIITKMRRKIENPNTKLKVYVYSGHGTNVAAVLNGLRIFNNRFPKYAATILFELHREINGSHTVRLLFSNATEPEKHIPPPHVLQLPGCGEYCPLEELERQTADLYPVDWKRECLEENLVRLDQLLKE